nr:MAG TPA: tail tape measure protein [Bacteriophage sp.]
MATELGQAYVQIVPSARGISGKIQSVIGPEASSAGESAGNLLGGNLISTVKKLVIAAGIGKAFSAAISEGAALQQSLGGVETLFKESAETVKQYANEAYRTTGLSANAYMENVTGFSASLLQSLGGDTAKAADVANMAMIDMADNSNKMGTSMENIQNAYQGFAKQNYTMLDNLKLGYGGTKSEMERLLADAEKLTGVKYDISNLSDVYQAIHAIQENLDITGTTAKEAASTFSGSLSAMKAAAQNVLGKLTLGEDIAPSLQALAETTSTFLFKNFLPMIGNILKALPGAIIGFVKAAIPAFINAGKEMLSGLTNGLSNGIPDFGMIILELMATIKDWIIKDAPKMIETGIRLLTELGNGFIQSLPDLLVTLVYILEDIFVAIANFAPQLLEGGVQLVMNLINGFVQYLPQFITSFDEILRSLVETISGTMPQVWQKGTEILLNLIQGLIDNLPAIGSAAIQMISMLIDTIVQNLPGIINAGWQVLTSLALGIIDKLPDLLAAAVSLMIQFVGMIISKLPDILSAGLKILISLVTGILQAIPRLISAVGKIGSTLLNGVSKINLFDAGKAILTGFLNGLKSVWNGITNFIGGIADWIGKHKGPIEYDRKLLIPHGRAIMDSLDDGLRDKFKDVKQTVGGMAGDIAGVFGNPNLSTNIEFDRKAMNDSLSIQSIKSGTAMSEFQKLSTKVDELVEKSLDIAEKALERPLQMVLDDDTLVAKTGDKFTNWQNNNEIIQNRMRGVII